MKKICDKCDHQYMEYIPCLDTGFDELSCKKRKTVVIKGHNTEIPTCIHDDIDRRLDLFKEKNGQSTKKTSQEME